jgi:4-alpha-glucanotransferase
MKQESPGTMAEPASSSNRDLFRLAQFHGVQTSYRDAFGRYQHVGIAPLLGILEGLRVGLERPADAGSLLLEQQRARWDFNLEPVVIAWDAARTSAPLHAPEDASGELRCTLQIDGGGEQRWDERLERLEIGETEGLAGRRYVERLIPLPQLAMGYHRLSVELGSRRWESLVIAAPTRAYEPPAKYWGLFAPLYAIHDERSWGTGDVRELQRFAEWVDKHGGDFVATLPLLPAYLEADHFLPSPYSPVSRLFWNELYADPEAAAKATGNTKALQWLAGAATQKELARLRSTPVVDYQGTWDLKRQMLGMLASEDAIKVRPDAVEYARFRATREKLKKPWKEWPERLRSGDLREGDYDREAFLFYVSSQRIIGEQFAAFWAGMMSRGQLCYLDLPIGSDSDGFDTWRYQSLFAHTVECGAPPDLLFTAGQAWGLPPMIPAEMRRTGYEYLRATLAHHLSLADIMRYDHVIGLHRLYWVPDGFSAREGIFVQYPAEELYAILSVESHRARSVIVGENLGTVPQRINRALARHGIYETYVLQYEIPLEQRRQVRPAPLRSLAGLNTHDMPTFAGFLEGKDLTIQETLGIREHDSVVHALAERTRQVEVLRRELEAMGLLEPGDVDPEHLFKACVKMLRDGRARYVVMNIEDFWLEPEGQNIPGTATGNWQRRLALALDELPDPKV